MHTISTFRKGRTGAFKERLKDPSTRGFTILHSPAIQHYSAPFSAQNTDTLHLSSAITPTITLVFTPAFTPSAARYLPPGICHHWSIAKRRSSPAVGKERRLH